MARRVLVFVALAFLSSIGPLCRATLAQGGTSTPPKSDARLYGTWSFAASGDSRNCGDVVMPAIAAGVRSSGASFYWHLGDLRAIYTFDEDMQHESEHAAKPMNISDYLASAWDDFIQNQLLPFGTLPVFLGIGNHDVIPPMTRDAFLIQFADWLDAPSLRKQRLSDDAYDRKLKTYYHWIEDGIDFINLDNASPDQFSAAQVAWFEKVLAADSSNPQIRAVVVGMHEALPYSLSESHSMNQSPVGIESGLRVYADLLKAQNDAHKHVYVLASHSHYYMAGTFNTDYWRAHGGVLPGWIVGTAGAVRYALPAEHANAHEAETDVYGFLLGTVQSSGEINFAYKRLSETDVPALVAQRFTPQFVHWCFVENSQAH
jgi:hypothetical protein